ncbi:hypothetical protein MKX03_037002 [Papaver bracteatum]|nr:hypothetical protein MKX03_037002 [Papaver bracteatum]
MASTLVQNTVTAAQEHETFQNFFESWISEQNRDLQELISASQARAADRNNHHEDSSSRSLLTCKGEAGNQEQVVEENVVRPLINRVVRHYENYYRIKHEWVQKDVLSMLTPSWRSSLEEAFLWIGGWRPSMAFHLLYSKAGIQLEARLADIIRGLSTGDLADLSASQLANVDELHRRTLREEKEVTEKMAEHQETVADSSMVELSHVVTELIRNSESNQNNDDELEDRIESTLAPKEAGLETIMEKADDLRVRTLKGVIDILTPSQAVDFLIAAAELHLRLHDWGKKKDMNQNNQVQDPQGTHDRQYIGSPVAATAGGSGEEP